MRQESSKISRAVLAGVGVVVAFAAFVVVSGRPEPMAAQTAPQQAPSRFMGGNPSGEDIGDIRTQLLRFPAGSRSNWHSHVGGGQLLMLQQGRALTQVRGEPIYEMRANEPWYTPEGVEHWHGAHPDEAALQLTIYGGTVNWLEPVQDAAYRAPSRRR
ncbi:MAG: cupin domain-containing protein [Gemmatimonadetes bacterium]|nr:cupin domain-containing protein [Gemmatimonadota bacterium]